MPTKEDQYEEAVDDAREDFEDYAREYIDGEISLDEFRGKMRDRIRDLYILLALLGAGGTLDSDREVADLEAMIDDVYGMLDDLILTLEEEGDSLSDRYVIWRAGIFSMARPGFVRFLTPVELWDVLPEHPGISCLGDGACQCSLEWETMDNGDIAVYWLLGPAEHCAVCISLAVDWQPYIVHAEDIFL